MMFGQTVGQGWLQLGELGLALVLSALIGLEREFHQKSAGLRTYTLVGFASALFLLVSKYGFTNILEANRIVLDPSRIAAQIVSGIGFIGGGVIFVRKDIVRGLTTAATVWLTSAVGMACGAGLPVLAIAVTAGHLFVVAVLPAVERRLPKSRWAPSQIHVAYRGRQGVLRQVLALCTQHDFVVSRVNVEGERDLTRHGKQRDEEPAPVEQAVDDPRRAADVVTLRMEVRGARSIPKLATRIADIPGVVSVQAGDADTE